MIYFNGWFVDPENKNHIYLNENGRIAASYYNYNQCPIEFISDKEMRVWMNNKGFRKMTEVELAKFYLVIER